LEKVILVNEQDEQLGLMEKMEAHEKGLLHRAFSVFIFNDKGEMMMQQRALHKYHSGGLWTNTCCSHPRVGESTEAAAKRRLQEEMGFSCDVKEVFHFIYKATLDNNLTEHELDHVFFGYFNGFPQINPEEVASWKWMHPLEVASDMHQNPDQYTAWFKIIFKEYSSYIGSKFS
jgi:isopentenyl-diphosphate delta-isomerase